MSNLRIPQNVSLSDTCPHCSRRVWYTDEIRKFKRVYYPPQWLRQLFKAQVGTSILGPYYVHRCEVCGKTVAVFSQNKGVLYGKVIVLYACTLLDKHVTNDDDYRCEDTHTCYCCPLKTKESEGEAYVRKR